MEDRRDENIQKRCFQKFFFMENISIPNKNKITDSQSVIKVAKHNHNK